MATGRVGAAARNLPADAEASRRKGSARVRKNDAACRRQIAGRPGMAERFQEKAMKRLVVATLLAAGLTFPALAADPKQELTINRGSTSDRISGLVVQGDSIVLVYGAPGMGAANQAVRITPDGSRLRVVYDTVGNLGVNTAGLQPMMMMTTGGFQWPVYQMSTGHN
jgi:hypothetical protein